MVQIEYTVNKYWPVNNQRMSDKLQNFSLQMSYFTYLCYFTPAVIVIDIYRL